MSKATKIIKRQLTTEKTTKAKESQNKYVFEVLLKATENKVAQEVSKVYKVEVMGVNLMIVPGKKRRLFKKQRFMRLPKWKKAIVELKEGQKIEEEKADKKDKTEKKISQKVEEVNQEAK